jgi:hypothetical protein
MENRQDGWSGPLQGLTGLYDVYEFCMLIRHSPYPFRNSLIFFFSKKADTQRYFLQKYEICAIFGVGRWRRKASVAKQRGSHIQHTTALHPRGSQPHLGWQSRFAIQKIPLFGCMHAQDTSSWHRSRSKKKKPRYARFLPLARAFRQIH